jgi:catechol 2,3-dioxygenase-like lactoylglutathione lyase family enzyme
LRRTQLPADGRRTAEEESLMKRFHVHVSVGDLNQSIQFYTEFFGSQPSVLKSDYARWMLDDPRVNFAISQRGAARGVQHLGIQAEDRAELEEVYGRLQSANAPVLEEGATTCCYAKSDKSWIEDPQGVQWETFLTSGESTVYGHDPVRTELVKTQETTCCAPNCCSPQAA